MADDDDIGELLPHPGTGALFPSPVPPGSGWPEDPADANTPVSRTATEAVQLAASAQGLAALDARISVCRACPRLVDWREDVARTKRRSFADQPYWGRPVPGFGDTHPKLLIVGLAPAANGANRTSRMFTGDRAGDWLFAALHRAGLAALPGSDHAGDGQQLYGVRVVSTVRCAPPLNKPTTLERDTCAPWLHAELAMLLPQTSVIVALGHYGWDATLRTVREIGGRVPVPKPRFGHNALAVVVMPGGAEITVLGCFHPSQQNTFTGRLTAPMLDEVFTLGRQLAGL
ncbi:uracil-DNA glycosylase [Tomitella biformata]|uniref:uracil-DNA glycosylase n=1 Tax=Tomitella biformata TaxID=630403 RepID=UPI000465A1B1|nr:uracil-DNA glycosylase [Tomitella biformata]